ncbi:hypothetical protein BH11CYA1_BH11CYA1_10170 [soil metagenome]
MELEPSEIIFELVKKYNECTSYSDEGVATDRDISVRFCKKFIRPNDLWFQCSEEREGLAVGNSTVRSQKGSVQFLRAGKWTDVRDLHFALTIIGAASAGASLIVSRLLFCPISDNLWQQYLPYKIENIDHDTSVTILSSKSKLTHATDLIHVDVANMTLLEHHSVLTNNVSAGMASRLSEIGVKSDHVFAKLFLNFLGNPILYSTSVKFERVNFDCLDSIEELRASTQL